MTVMQLGGEGETLVPSTEVGIASRWDDTDDHRVRARYAAVNPLGRTLAPRHRVLRVPLGCEERIANGKGSRESQIRR